MDRRISALGALVLGLAACSLINSTEDLKPVEGENSSGSGPVASAGKNSGGSTNNQGWHQQPASW